MFLRIIAENVERRRMATIPSPTPTSVTATQLVRDFPEARRLVDKGPVHVTSHGRTDVVMLSPQDYSALTTQQQPDASHIEWKLSLVLDSIETHVMILDEQLNIRRINRHFAESFGVSADDVAGRNILNLGTRPADQFIVQRLGAVLRSGQPEVLVVPSPQDAARILRVTMKPWPGGVVLFAEDVTERERTGDRKIADDATDAAVDALGGVGFAHVQSNGVILSSTKALAHMLGSPADSLTGARLQNLFDPSCRSLVNDALKDTSSAQRCHEVRYLRHGVTLAPATLSVSPYWTAEHHACAAIVLHDPQFIARDCSSEDRAA
jgi:PAS domain S-box-containing protein